ncbi:shikimate dehydrogenase AroE [Gottschalkia purinilytica]|uniref:Shikimate dehydrogenase (NADP(+)) n=1 Tax=Gottschalkia purinilytica TaxID=1503 RepID=A0A0L0WEF4_GOTPU|nr:shikimate dehydrogenase [Gottschalkia purinilytica]KNF09862.1 shikimate dehydrogenase AroE [Gottschalkia purinilytica]
MQIDSNTKLYCLIGHPISKSLSPDIHNYSFEQNNINAKYMAFDVLEENLESSIKGIKALGINGFNVTIPHKVNIIKYLDDIDEEAKLLGAVNTVKNVNGKLIGFNTDGRGFIQVLKDKNIKIKDKNILMIGAGGAARAISIILAKEGINKIKILNRTKEKSIEIINEIKEKFPNVIGTYGTLSENREEISDTDIAINCTSIGMYPDVNCLPIDPNIFPNDTIVCDIVYKPLLTKFLKVSQEIGLDTIGGLDMLIYQGILSEEIWLEKNVDKNMVINWFKKRKL